MSESNENSNVPSKYTVNGNISNGSKLNGIPVQNLDNFNDAQLDELVSGHNKTKAKTVDCGWIGIVIGANAKNAAVNIAGIVSIGFMCCCVLDAFLVIMEKKQSFSTEMWTAVTPILTMILGYIFGRGQ